MRNEIRNGVFRQYEIAMPLVASRLDRALAACAKALPARLAHDYGASEFYTTGQITPALAALKIPPEAAPYAYAMFLPETTYEAASPTYAEARAAFMRNAPAKTIAGDFYESGLGVPNGLGH